MGNDIDARLRPLLRDDASYQYSSDELDAIEAIDPAMALRLDRVQFMAAQCRSAQGNEAEVDAVQVGLAIDEARRILSRDGGDIELVAVEGRTVRVRLKGACVGCPNSVMDLRNVVERLVRARAPGVSEVVNAF